MAVEPTTKAPAKAPAKSAEKAAPAAAPAAAEQLDNQPAAPADTTAPTDPAPVGGAAATGTATDTVADLDLDDGEIEGLWITAIPEQGFRRCGFRFTREGVGIALDALTAGQIETLENEPNLKVERGIFSGRVCERLE